MLPFFLFSKLISFSLFKLLFHHFRRHYTHIFAALSDFYFQPICSLILGLVVLRREGANLRQLLAAVRNHRERHRCVNFHKAPFVFLLSNGNIGKLWPKIFLRKVNVHAIKLYRLIRNRIRNL